VEIFWNVYNPIVIIIYLMAQNNNLHAKKKIIPFILFMDGGHIIKVIQID